MVSLQHRHTPTHTPCTDCIAYMHISKYSVAQSREPIDVHGLMIERVDTYGT